MIQGIGLDIVELNRMEKKIHHEKFVGRILTEKEKERFLQLNANRKIEFLAGRFAAKEAYSKALGTGIGKGVSFLDIEILNNEAGKPVLHDKSRQNREKIVHISITHTKEYAAAQVIIESSSC